MRTPTSMLLLSVITFISFGALKTPDNGTNLFPSMISPLTQGKFATKPLGKHLATSFAWENTGTIYYVNNATSGDPIDWAFSSRDTTVFDANGNQILYKQTSASTGWTTDSLTYLDSSVFSGGACVETIEKRFSHPDVSGTRTTVSILNSDKIHVETDYTWNDSKSLWIPITKDSMIFSAPPSTGYYPNLTGMYYYIYDTTGSVWKSYQYYVKVDAECNATTLTLGGKVLLSTTSDSMVDSKEILAFNSSSWTQENQSQLLFQRKNGSNGTYYDYTKYTFTTDGSGSKTVQISYWNALKSSLINASKDITSYDANGHETGYQLSYWDTASNSFANITKKIYVPDSHSNDTLSVEYYYNASTHSWDTSAVYRYERTYDGNGNNLVTINSEYDTYGKTWTIDSKDVHTYAQITTPVLHFEKPAEKPVFSVVANPTRIIITAPGITKLMLYNAAGRMVASVTQEAADKISVRLSGGRVHFSPGIYIAKIVQGEKQSSFMVTVRR